MKKTFFSLIFTFSVLFAFAQEGFIGEIRLFGGNFAPRNWAFCEGQLLAINNNQALFSILGTTYGGDGRTTFALPKLEGPIHDPGKLLVPQVSSQQSRNYVTAIFANQTTEKLAVENINAQGEIKQTGSVAAGASFSQKSTEGTCWQFRRSNGELIHRVILIGRDQQNYNVKAPKRLKYIICMQGVFPSRN